MVVYKPEQSHDELLAAVHREAESEGGNTALAIPPFATLLVKLSREADEQARTNLKIQHWLIGLTVALLLFTVLLLVLTWLMYLKML